MNYADDAPLLNPKDDLFGLAPFARRLTRVLRGAQQRDNVVVGLNGAWGSGKTTAINFSLAYLMAVETAGLDPFARDEQAEERALEEFLEKHGSSNIDLRRAE